jgi:hypothetical protein
MTAEHELIAMVAEYVVLLKWNDEIQGEGTKDRIPRWEMEIFLEKKSLRLFKQSSLLMQRYLEHTVDDKT